LGETYSKWLIAVGVTLGAWVLGWVLRRLLLGRVGSLLAKTDSRVDDIIFFATRRHVVFWFVLLGIVSGARIAPISPGILLLIDRGATSLFIVSLSLVVARIAGQLVNYYTQRSDAVAGTAGVTRGLVRGAILLVGGLMVLSSLGVAIGPLLGALGVGSLAVALALQPTLSNLVAGALITATKKIRPGDVIELETGQRGVVVDVTWRATQIHEMNDNLVIIPNAKLADSIVRNYSLPRDELTTSVTVGVGYGSDLAHVERVTLEAARSVMADVPGGVPTFEPVVRFQAFGESAIQVNVAVRVRRFTERPEVIHETIKRLHARYRQEGIEIARPARDVRMIAGGSGP
jgi:small-conductance mechanosensitive channel